MFEKIKKWYDLGLWTGQMVKKAGEKGLLTVTQVAKIVGSEEEN